VSVRQAPKAENGFSMLKSKKKAKASTRRTQRAQRKTKTIPKMKGKRRKKST
jgi:hypothetical protein